MAMYRWRLLTTWDAPPGVNMGLDEALLERPSTPPTLRLYSWSPDTLSLGYFQRYADARGTAQAGAIVRRITGGGAIHHVNELTFSLVAPLAHPLYRCPLDASYARVHGAVTRALSVLGVEAHLRGEAALASDVAGTGMCFHASTSLDLCWGGRKGVGSAQRRRANRVLHHGSVKLGPSSLEEGAATVSGSGVSVTPEGFAPVLIEAFGEELGMRLEAGEVEPEELAEGERRGERYVSEEFVRRR